MLVREYIDNPSVVRYHLFSYLAVLRVRRLSLSTAVLDRFLILDYR